MKINFQRIISKGKFIPEIDGLRFIAISGVVFYHLGFFISGKDMNQYDVEYNFDFLYSILRTGGIGVRLFFVISGFILAKSFAQMYINNGPKIKLKKYFIRRLTRLEPPYIIVMTALLFASIYVAKTISLYDGLVSYFHSITYTHNIFYGKDVLPLINGAAWTLEIEIQFYILMPLIATIFTIKNHIKRRILILVLGFIFLVADYFDTILFTSIFNFIEYFLVGVFLADCYVTKSNHLKKTKYDGILTVSVFIIVLFFEMINGTDILDEMIIELAQLVLILVFNYLVLFRSSLKFLVNPIVTGIGGMCYTIYLIHYALISMFGNPLMGIVLSNNSLINKIFYASALIVLVLFVSSAFFLIVERPCMKKDWYKIKIKPQ